MRGALDCLSRTRNRLAWPSALIPPCALSGCCRSRDRARCRTDG